MNTPTFSADMTHLIFRPYWDVPRSIATAELLPAERRRPGYLAANNLEVVDGPGRVVPVSESSLEAVAAGTMRLRQQPGEDNSLGRVKFVLPNSHAVYLHDTPHRELFARRQRAFSHGCVRVSDPTSLAQFVLQDLPEWSRERIGQAMLGTTPLRVDLPEPVRVYIVYGTALAREDGTVSFHDDIYGLDARERAGGPVMR
jgi:murein L,D-transpeptidase YcbB/YkuD